MERYTYLLDAKKQQKKLAKSIRKLKQQRRSESGYGVSLWKLESEIYQARREYRHRHIAYCILCGRSRDEIEKPSANNLPNELYIKKILNSYEEALCVSAEGS